MRIIERIKNIVLRLLKIVSKPEMLVLPGELAFFFLLAIVPTISLIALGTSLFNSSASFLTNFMTKAFGSDIALLVMPIVRDFSFSPGFLFALFVSFYTASTGASSIIITSNELFDVKNTNFFRRKVKAILMTFIMIFLLVFVLLIPVFGDKIVLMLHLANINEKVFKVLSFIIYLASGPVSWLVTFFLIKIIYVLAPDVKFSSHLTTKGALFTTFGFSLVTYLYSFFVNNFAHYDLLYGGLAHFAVLMIWLYLLSYIVTISLAINSEEFKRWQKKEQ